MKQIFEKFIENLFDKIIDNNFEKIKISDFNFEFKNENICYDIKYISPCVILEKNNNKICEWLLNENSSKKYTENILDDFSNIINNKKFEKEISEKISFFNSKIMPEINKMIHKTKDDNKIERMFKNLCNDYVFGDSQTRCIITMLFFRGIESKESRKKIRNLLPNYMKKTWDATLRIKKA